MSIKKTPRLVEVVQDGMRLHHCSIHTESACCDWIKRYVLHYRQGSRDDFKGGEGKIAEFLTHLAAESHGVAPSTQWQPVAGLKFCFFPLFLSLVICDGAAICRFKPDPMRPAHGIPAYVLESNGGMFSGTTPTPIAIDSLLHHRFDSAVFDFPAVYVLRAFQVS
ncbi:MAG: phage integrase N-terminal SAM-like domain-containing protein [Desulfobacterales bacterium]